MNSGHSTDVAHQKPPGPAPISYRTLVTKPDAQGASGTDGVILSRRLCSLNRLLGMEMLVLKAHISEDRAIRQSYQEKHHQAKQAGEDSGTPGNQQLIVSAVGGQEPTESHGACGN